MLTSFQVNGIVFDTKNDTDVCAQCTSVTGDVDMIDRHVLIQHKLI